ncbi:hypothetical protein VTG60DRAFT_3401 [Thermothelomyces hinnuleus]
MFWQIPCVHHGVLQPLSWLDTLTSVAGWWLHQGRIGRNVRKRKENDRINANASNRRLGFPHRTCPGLLWPLIGQTVNLGVDTVFPQGLVGTFSELIPGRGSAEACLARFLRGQSAGPRRPRDVGWSPPRSRLARPIFTAQKLGACCVGGSRFGVHGGV